MLLSADDPWVISFLVPKIADLRESDAISAHVPDAPSGQSREVQTVPICRRRPARQVPFKTPLHSDRGLRLGTFAKRRHLPISALASSTDCLR